MLAVLGVGAFYAVLFLVTGLPVALLLRRRSEGWLAVAVDALPLGLVVTTLGLTLCAWLGVAGAVLAALVWLGAVLRVILARDFRVTVLPGSPDGPKRPSRWLLRGAWAVLVVVAVALRLHDVNFLPWVGDMGAYVNWANAWHVRGYFVSSWPPLFAIYLSIASTLFGAAHTAAGVALSGVILVLTAARLLQRLGVPAWVVFGAAALIAVSPDAVWFSTFPGSESLNAPLFLVWAGLFVGAATAERRQFPFVIATFGVVTLALCLLRGSGALLMLPLVIVVVLAFAVRGWREYGPRLVVALGSALLGAGIGYWYGITVIPRYFVATQVKGLLPKSLDRLGDRLGLFDGTPLVLALVTVLPLLVMVLGWWLGRRASARALARRIAGDPVDEATTPDARRSRLVFAIGAVVAVVLLGGVIADDVVNAMVFAILLRLNILLVVGAAAALLLLRRIPREQQPSAVLLGVTTVMFIGLHTVRLGFNRGHSFYLYWDRYLVSEVFPATVVLTAVAIGMLIPMMQRRRSHVLTAVVAAVAIVVPSVGALALQSRDTYMAGAYDFTVKLADIAKKHPTDPIVWSGTSEGKAPGFFFPNTWMAFALPLKRSLGLDVVNADQSRKNTLPDEVLDAQSLFEYVACSPGSRGSAVVFETQSGGPSLDARLASDKQLVFTSLGEVTSDISLLAQPPLGGWTHARIPVKAWLVSLPSNVSIVCPLSGSN